MRKITKISQGLNKILKDLATELTVEVTKVVTERLRDSYEEDVTAIVKDWLSKDDAYRDAGVGFMSIEALAKKYETSRRTVNEKCRIFKEGDFKIERKWVAGKNLVNERQWVEACGQKAGRAVPKFLRDKEA